jgi:ferredoxin
MSVRIQDSCICCGACIDECPVEAIVDDNDNPTNSGVYFVYEDKCVECVGYNDMPQCAMACPTDGCFIWSIASEIPSVNRGNKGEPVIQ